MIHVKACSRNDHWRHQRKYGVKWENQRQSHMCYKQRV